MFYANVFDLIGSVQVWKAAVRSGRKGVVVYSSGSWAFTLFPYNVLGQHTDWAKVSDEKFKTIGYVSDVYLLVE